MQATHIRKYNQIQINGKTSGTFDHLKNRQLRSDWVQSTWK